MKTINITTYNQLISMSDFGDIIIIDDDTEEGYLKFKGKNKMYIKLFPYQKYTKKKTLRRFLKHNKSNFQQRGYIVNDVMYNNKQFRDMIIQDDNYDVVKIKYNLDALVKNILLKRNILPTYYVQKRHEYIIGINRKSGNGYEIFDSKHNTLIGSDHYGLICENDDNKHTRYDFSTIDFDDIDTDLVESIMRKILSDPNKVVEYKTFFKNLLTGTNNLPNVYIDYHKEKEWNLMDDIAYNLMRKIYCEPVRYDYWRHDDNFLRKKIKDSGTRLVIARKVPHSRLQSEINKLKNMGFDNILICCENDTSDYNKESDYMDYVETIRHIISGQTNRVDFIVHADEIFDGFLGINFLKWV